MNNGVPLTDRVNAPSAVSSVTLRKPISRVQVSSTVPSAATSVTSSGYSGCSPSVCGHHSSGDGTRAVSPVASTPATRMRTVPSPSTSVRTVTTPSVPSTVITGRTAASRPVVTSRRAGRQSPAVTSEGPQSQPKLQAILRMKFDGSPSLVRGSGWALARARA